MLTKYFRLFAVVMALLSASSHAWSQQTAVPSNNLEEKDYPCALVLCFANPNGWESVGTCVPPVNWLIKNFIEEFKPWPQCIGGDGQAINSYANNTHVSCPSGFTAEQVSVGDHGTMAYTGVCLRQLGGQTNNNGGFWPQPPQQSTVTCQGFTPTVQGGQCVGYTQNNDFYSWTTYYEFVIPGVTNYSMDLRNANGSISKSYFNLGGNGTSPALQSSIIFHDQQTQNANGYYFGSGGGSRH
ncbi:TPA: hypothetical protein ACK3SM_004317 [Burkholderia cepacia]